MRSALWPRHGFRDQPGRKRDGASLVLGGGTEGAYPYGALLWGSQGALYGTASGGGLFGFGTVFKVKP